MLHPQAAAVSLPVLRGRRGTGDKELNGDVVTPKERRVGFIYLFFCFSVLVLNKQRQQFFPGRFHRWRFLFVHPGGATKIRPPAEIKSRPDLGKTGEKKQKTEIEHF